MNFHTATTLAKEVDRIALVATVVSGALILLVGFLLVYFCFKYRKGSAADRSHRQASSAKIELLNIGVMLAFGLGLFLWSAQVFYRQYAAPRDALDLYVLGKQWMWVFQYPAGAQEIGRIKVPVRRPVRLLLTSDDVIHSFYVPEFRIKQDALPGRYTTLWFQAEELGEFTVLCTEMCGTSHSAMRATIEVVSAEEFAAYQRGARAITGEGAKIFRRMGCATCHEGKSAVGPSLAGLYGKRVPLSSGADARADENYLRRSLLEPAREIVRGYRPLMPTYQGMLSEAEILALVEYIKSLRKEDKL